MPLVWLSVKWRRHGQGLPSARISYCRPMNRLTRLVAKAPRLLQPRTPLRHIRKMKKSSPSPTRRSMRRGTSRRLAPVQTTRRGNVNGYLYHHPPRSYCRPMNRLTRLAAKAPRLLQPRTPLRHIRKMKKSSPSATRRSMRRGTSRRLAPVQTTRRGNVNDYLYHHPPRSYCRPMNVLTRLVAKAPRLLQPRTPLRHIRKMKNSSPSATRRSMRRGTSRRLAPVQTTRRGNVNGYLYHHPPRSLSGKIRRAHQLGTTIGQPPPEELAPDDERNCRRCIITAGAAARPPRSTATTAKRNRIFRPSILQFQAPSLDDALSTLDDLYSWTVSDRTAITCC